MEDYLKINLEAFNGLDEDLLRENNLKYALLHDGKLVEIYNDLEDAYKIGRKEYPKNDFLIRQIDALPASFGVFNDRIITI